MFCECVSVVFCECISLVVCEGISVAIVSVLRNVCLSRVGKPCMIKSAFSRMKFTTAWLGSGLIIDKKRCVLKVMSWHHTQILCLQILTFPIIVLIRPSIYSVQTIISRSNSAFVLLSKYINVKTVVILYYDIHGRCMLCFANNQTYG